MKSVAGPVLAALVLAAPAIHAEDDRAKNLETCLAGKYRSLCKHQLLTNEQRIAVRAAELRENLAVCMTGKYRSLCQHAELLPGESEAVRAAELRENLRVCMTGKYRSLCNHSDLSAEEKEFVLRAELQENLRICMTGKYRSLCRHAVLEPEERKRVDAAERTENRRICMSGKAPSLCERSWLTPQERTEADAKAKKATTSPPNAGRTSCYESSITDPAPFMGNDGEVFRLADGSLWEVQYEYEYLYEYYPSVVICPAKGLLIVDDESLDVRALGGGDAPPKGAGSLIESRIDGEFEGWDGETIFKLQNGQIWQQNSYAYKYKYAYSPRVLIFLDGGVYRMRVDGVEDTISVTRIR